MKYLLCIFLCSCSFPVGQGYRVTGIEIKQSPCRTINGVRVCGGWREI